MNQPVDPTRIIVFPCILSYPSLFEKKRWEDNDKEYYQTDLWFPVSEQRYQENFATLAAARAAAISGKWGANPPHKMYDPIRNLADVRDLPEGMSGFFVRAKSAVKVAVRRKDPNSPPGRDVYIDVTNPEDVYPGVVAAVSLTALAFDTEKQKGVSFWLNQVVLLRDGVRLGGVGAKSAEEEFGNTLTGQFGVLTTADARTAATMAPAAPMVRQYAPQTPPGYATPPMPQAPPMPAQNVPPQFAPPGAMYPVAAQPPQPLQFAPPGTMYPAAPPQYAPPGPHIPGMPGQPLPY